MDAHGGVEQVERSDEGSGARAGAAGTRFEFGQNWARFLERMTPERLERAQRSLLDFTGLRSLEGLSFVDVGCGSGLFSWAAHHLGAERIVSFDYDLSSVACCEELRRRSGEPGRWTVFRGSILDRELVQRLGIFDVVYSWGVLHHTGDMWTAIDNAMELVADDGLFFIALYNKKRGWRGSRWWEKRKQLYCKLPRAGQKALVGLQLAYWAQSKLFRGKNPFRSAREYDTVRGMDLVTDVADWIGGYPYEYATIAEVFRHVTERDGRMRLLNVSGGEGLGCNQYLFRRERI
jgi:2-polyprenyl-6-hydroxyphenyl methylase/3-demethylubiquinone-9 3-methyltransferase